MKNGKEYGIADRRRSTPSLPGELNPNWKGGRHISSHGYVKILVGKGHPLADSKGYAYEHVVVWVSAGNPHPIRGITNIHHLDGNKQNNSLDNLTIIPQSDHAKGHAAKRLGLSEGSLDRLSERYRAGESYISLALEVGLRREALSRILRRTGRLPMVTHDRRSMLGRKGASIRWRS